MVKDVQIYIYWVKKNTCLGILKKEEIRDKDHATGLKEGGGIEMSIYSAFHIRDARSLRFEYSPCHGVLQQFGTFSFLQYSNVALIQSHQSRSNAKRHVALRRYFPSHTAWTYVVHYEGSRVNGSIVNES